MHAPDISKHTKPPLHPLSCIQKQDESLDKRIRVIEIFAIALPHRPSAPVILMLLHRHERILVLHAFDTGGLELGSHAERSTCDVLVRDEARRSVNHILDSGSTRRAGEEGCFHGQLEHVGLGDVVRRYHVHAHAASEGCRAESAEEAEDGMLAHGIHGLRREGAQRCERADEEQATISRRGTVLGKPVQGEVSGVSSARDIDVELLRVGLGKFPVLENRLLKLKRGIREDNTRVRDDDIDSSMGTDMHSRLKQADLLLPIRHIAVLKRKSRVRILLCELRHELLTRSISDVADDYVCAVRSPLTDHERPEAIGTACDEDGLAIERGSIVGLAHVDGR
ncbi:hypothetical protein HG530_002022 [Fusarium avenaceum]|nr:hypothetical protein HG530_002022 [Fusarium avenaceum]